MKVDVLLLAGARTKGSLRELSAVEHEALIKIADMPMVEYVIRAVKDASLTGRVIIVGPRNDLECSVNERVDLIIDSGDDLVQNIERGIKALDPQNYILLITSDIPLISSEIIDEFILSCQDSEADIYYPIISKKNSISKYPGAKRTYVHLAEGVFTGGNLVLIRPYVLQDGLDFLQKVILWRKKPWKLSQLLGLKFVFKFLMGNLSINEIEERLYKIIGYKGRGMISEHPEIGFDVDKPSDLQLMREKYIL
jgi:GTP:adenosylcobinamide-phosphate guanylyltransferase